LKKKISKKKKMGHKRKGDEKQVNFKDGKKGDRPKPTGVSARPRGN